MIRRQRRSNPFSVSAEVLEVRAMLSSGAVATAQSSIVGQLATTTPVTASTVPANGDVNPYGTAFVPEGFVRGGALHPGDLLVSNFNNSGNLQGTGTTIVRITPTGQMSTFFQGQPGLGLTTALGVLKGGFVIVGSMPTTDGTSATVQPGELLILDKNGHVIETLKSSTKLDGPWDLTVNDLGPFAQVFVSNVLSGTITRIDMLVLPGLGKPLVLDEVQIASGYAHHSDPAALEVGPTGLAFDARTDTLFVASTGDNEIFAVHNAAIRFTDGGTGSVIYSDPVHLHGPLALVLAPNGDLIVSNGDAVNPDPAHSSELVEFTQQGKFVGQFQVDTVPGAAFGIALTADDGKIRFAAVDDNTNTVSIWTLNAPGADPDFFDWDDLRLSRL